MRRLQADGLIVQCITQNHQGFAGLRGLQQAALWQTVGGENVERAMRITAYGIDDAAIDLGSVGGHVVPQHAQGGNVLVFQHVQCRIPVQAVVRAQQDETLPACKQGLNMLKPNRRCQAGQFCTAEFGEHIVEQLVVSRLTKEVAREAVGLCASQAPCHVAPCVGGVGARDGVPNIAQDARDACGARQAMAYRQGAPRQGGANKRQMWKVGKMEQACHAETSEYGCNDARCSAMGAKVKSLSKALSLSATDRRPSPCESRKRRGTWCGMLANSSGSSS